MTETSIHRHFKHLDDPRLDRRKKYPLINLIFIAFCAVLCGAEDWVSITRGKARFKATIQYVVNEQGLPMAVFENKNRTFKKSNIQHGYLTFPLPNGHGSDFLRIH